MAAKIPRGSIEYLHVPITLDEDSLVTTAGITQVEIAVVADTVAPAEVPAGAWRVAFLSVQDSLSAVAKVLLDGTLAAGRYAVHVRITAPPEKPLRKSGVLTVT